MIIYMITYVIIYVLDISSEENNIFKLFIFYRSYIYFEKARNLGNICVWLIGLTFFNSLELKHLFPLINVSVSDKNV